MAMSPGSNESTSVTASLPRNCLLSARMRASETSAMVRSAGAAPGAVWARPAATPGPGAVRPRPSVMETAILLPGSTVGFVRLDDLLDERVPHHVPVVEVHERDSLDVAHHFHRLGEPRLAAGRQVDLGHVAGDDRLRAEAETGQEHLHLFR